MAIDNSKLLFVVLPYNCTIYIYPTKLIFVGAIIVTSNTIYSSRIHGILKQYQIYNFDNLWMKLCLKYNVLFLNKQN